MITPTNHQQITAKFIDDIFDSESEYGYQIDVSYFQKPSNSLNLKAVKTKMAFKLSVYCELFRYCLMGLPMQNTKECQRIPFIFFIFHVI